MHTHLSLIVRNVQGPRVQRGRQALIQALARVRARRHKRHVCVVPNPRVNSRLHTERRKRLTGLAITGVLQGSKRSTKVAPQHTVAVAQLLPQGVLDPVGKGSASVVWPDIVLNGPFTNGVNRKARLLGRHHGAQGGGPLAEKLVAPIQPYIAPHLAHAHVGVVVVALHWCVSLFRQIQGALQQRVVWPRGLVLAFTLAALLLLLVANVSMWHRSLGALEVLPLHVD